jgi:hypothetical protein
MIDRTAAALVLLGSLGCTVPEDTDWDAVDAPDLTDGIDPEPLWTCDIQATSCFCAFGAASLVSACDLDYPCCIYRDADIGETCECTLDDETACVARMTGDLYASRVSSCPP